MTRKIDALKKVLSLVICVMVVLSCLTLLLSGSASAQREDTRVVDPSTMDDWKSFFLGNNTENSGAIWTDKSVFTDEEAFGSLVTMEDNGNNFLVALSAISAQTKVKGYAYLPTDAVFVVDVSRRSNNHDVQELVDSVNNAISDIQNKNKNNRVGVVLYSGDSDVTGVAGKESAQVILPLGRYTQAESRYLVKGQSLQQTVLLDTVKVNAGVTSEDGTPVSETSKAFTGGAYVQSGLYAAMNEFLGAEDTAVNNGGFQQGTKRIPALVLVNNTAPNFGSSEYMEPDKSDLGNGSTPEDELASAIPFLTQLTASYTKEKIEEHYGRTALFYTVGYREGDVSVVAPSESDTTDAHWESYKVTPEGGVMQLAVKSSWVSSGWYGSGHWDTEYKPVYKCEYDLDEDYTDGFFCADGDFSGAFDGATDAIVAKSMYYPTRVDSGNTEFDGYVEFIDDVGQYMEVKKVHGILLGDYLFTGNNIAKNFVGSGGALGTLDKPSNLGDEMIRAVKARLGIEKTADAQKLVDDAYRAGQLAYDPQTGEYSNYIGWYADKDGKYICHGTADDTVYPEGAEFYNESYGYLGEVFDKNKDSDMMYVSVQVHTRLSTNTSAVIFRIPASLIPVINYEIELTGDSLKEAGDITFGIDSKMDIDTDDDGIADKQAEVSPIRLLFEVGLCEEINEFSISEVVKEDYKHHSDGEYTFYASRWDVEDLNHQHPSVAKNTVAFYSPSEENERYYYTKDDIVYKKSGDGYVPYTGAQSPAFGDETFYREFAVYEAVNDDEVNNGRQHLHYAEISSEVLGLAEANTKQGTPADENTHWYIPKGTIHRMVDSFHAGKGGFADENHTSVNANNTSTLIYSHYLGVENNPDGDGYYVDIILGNNGRLTLKQAQGLKLSADTDVTMLSREDVFEFAVKAENADVLTGEYRLVVTDENGEVSSEKVTFSDGEAVVRIKASCTAYLVDLPEGEKFTVTEHVTDNDYRISNVNGDDKDEFGFEVYKNTLEKVHFVHSLTPAFDSGALVLYNKIEHPFGEDYVVPENIEFTYLVEYTDKNAEKKSEGITLKPFETKHITDIATGDEVKITLKDVPAGFNSDMKENTLTVDVATTKYYVVEVTNTYKPESVSPQVSLVGNKKFTGRQNGKWLESDVFTVKLQKFAHSHWEDMVLDSGKIATATLTDSARRYDFSEFMCAEVYDTVGVYSYRVSEVFEAETSQGVSYDKGVRWFDVCVTDKDMDGRLEVDNIRPYGGTVVGELQDGTWKIGADFTNTYAVAGSDTVTIKLNNKVVTSDGFADVSAAGFEYGLYQGDRLVTIFPLTNEKGETLLTLTYGNFDIGKHIHYVVKQLPHAEPVENMEYSTQDYHIAVSVYDDNEGGIHAAITAQEHDENAPLVSGDEVTLEFTNVYNVKADPTEPTIPDYTEPQPTKPDTQDATSSTDKNEPVTPDVPDTGFLSAINIALWVFGGVIIVLALICMIFVGKKK